MPENYCEVPNYGLFALQDKEDRQDVAPVTNIGSFEGGDENADCDGRTEDCQS